MTSGYAANTKVSSEKSRAEIETILRRYGADDFGYYSRRDEAFVTFTAKNRKILFRLPLPHRDEKRFTQSQRYPYKRTDAVAYKLWDQECRQRWRALTLAIKSKLESVRSGITTFEEEFLAHIVLPDGHTVAHWIAPEIELAYTLGKMPQLALPPAAEEGEEQEDVQ